MDEIAKLEASLAEAKQKAEEAGGADESLNSALTESEAALEAAKKEVEDAKDIDYKKELERVAVSLPPPVPQRTEKDKAKYTVEKIYERFPDLKEDFVPPDNEEFDNKFSNLQQTLLRNQVEGIIRQNSKSDDEVKYKMFFYEHRIVKTGNIHEDADNAIWLAGKDRTRNALNEMKRTPPSPGPAAGPGQRSPITTAPELSIEDVKRLTQLGLKKVAPDRWEGTKFGLQYNKQTKVWEQISIPPKKK